MNKLVFAFLAGLIAMAVGGYWLDQRQPDGGEVALPKDEPNPQVTSGPLEKEETIPVGEVLNAVQGLNRLVIFQAYLTATTTSRDIGWFTKSNQTMLTPAFVNYYIDLSTLGAGSIRVQGKDIYIARPAIKIERPNIDTREVKIFNEGSWTIWRDESDALRRRNDRMAVRQLVQRANMAFLVNAARKAAAEAQESNMRRILIAMGHPEAIIHVGHDS